MAGKTGAAALALVLLAAGAARADILPNPTLEGGIALANVTISVADLDRSTKFYQALGFAAGDRHAIPPGLAQKSLGAKADAKLDVRFISRNSVLIELVHIVPTITKPASTGAAGQLGLSHFAFRVDDVSRVAALVKANGGTVDEATRASLGPAMEAVFCTDPDGTRLELVGPTKK